MGEGETRPPKVVEDHHETVTSTTTVQPVPGVVGSRLNEANLHEEA